MHPIPNKYEIHRAAIRTIVELPINERIPGPNANKRHHEHAHEKHADAPYRSCNATLHLAYAERRVQPRRATGDGKQTGRPPGVRLTRLFGPLISRSICRSRRHRKRGQQLREVRLHPRSALDPRFGAPLIPVGQVLPRVSSDKLPGSDHQQAQAKANQTDQKPGSSIGGFEEEPTNNHRGNKHANAYESKAGVAGKSAAWRHSLAERKS